MESRRCLWLSRSVSSAGRSSRLSSEVEAPAAAADGDAAGAGDVLTAWAGTTAAGEALVSAAASAGAAGAAGAGVVAGAGAATVSAGAGAVAGCSGCAAGGGADASSGEPAEDARGASCPRVASVKASVRATKTPKVVKRLRCFMIKRTDGDLRGGSGQEAFRLAVVPKCAIGGGANADEHDVKTGDKGRGAIQPPRGNVASQ